MAGTKDKGKVKIEPANPPRRGIWKCFDYLFPTLLAVVVMSYGGFLYNPDQARALARSYNALQPIVTFFDFVDEYSPFHEFINDLDTKQVNNLAVSFYFIIFLFWFKKQVNFFYLCIIFILGCRINIA